MHFERSSSWKISREQLKAELDRCHLSWKEQWLKSSFYWRNMHAVGISNSERQFEVGKNGLEPFRFQEFSKSTLQYTTFRPRFKCPELIAKLSNCNQTFPIAIRHDSWLFNSKFESQMEAIQLISSQFKSVHLPNSTSQNTN